MNTGLHVYHNEVFMPLVLSVYNRRIIVDRYTADAPTYIDRNHRTKSAVWSHSYLGRRRLYEGAQAQDHA